MLANFTLDDYLLQQVPAVVDVFPAFLASVQPVRILEIGTGHGGFTRLMSQNTTATILSCDLEQHHPDIPTFCDFHQVSGLDATFLSATATPFIQGAGLTLVLCDSPNNLEVFQTYAPLLKTGDLLLIHDYCSSMEVFHSDFKDTIWNWCEVTDLDLAATLAEHSLVAHASNATLNPIVWACFEKQ